jgi:hypothetical protein
MNWARALLLRSGRPCQLLMSLLVSFLSCSCLILVLFLSYSCPVLVLFLSCSCRCSSFYSRSLPVEPARDRDNHARWKSGSAPTRRLMWPTSLGKSSRDSRHAAEGRLRSMRSTSNFTHARMRGQPAPRRAARSASMRQGRPEASVPPAPQACPGATAGSASGWPRASSTLSGLHRTGKVSTIRSVG